MSCASWITRPASAVSFSTASNMSKGPPPLRNPAEKAQRQKGRRYFAGNRDPFALKVLGCNRTDAHDHRSVAIADATRRPSANTYRRRTDRRDRRSRLARTPFTCFLVQRLDIVQDMPESHQGTADFGSPMRRTCRHHRNPDCGRKQFHWKSPYKAGEQTKCSKGTEFGGSGGEDGAQFQRQLIHRFFEGGKSAPGARRVSGCRRFF